MSGAGDGVLESLCLTGPTATGKTELALGLAERFPVEIVSMDSAVVYRGLDVGTAKPSRAARARVRHHLVDILEPEARYSAGRFARDAARTVGEIRARGRIPVLVGGTLLYLRALRDGLAALPDGDADVRARLDSQARARGWPALHARLAAVDPEAAARIAPRDAQRIQRALEVHELTGCPLSSFHAGESGGARAAVDTLALVPDDRDALKRRIAQRFDSMVARGLVAEVARLRARGNLNPNSPSIRSVGYRQIWQYLDGELDWPAARERAIVATRQLAKRQLTWLRAETHCTRLDPFAPGAAERVEAWFGARAARMFEGAMC